MTLELIKGAALLLALSLLQSFNVRFWRQTSELAEKITSGVLFGGICVIGMMVPLEVVPGVIFDARSVILSMSGLFGGPIVGGIAAMIAGGYRAWIGGGGATVGVAVVLSCMFLGLAYRYCRDKGWVKIGVFQLLVFGLLVHAVEIALFTQLPADIVQKVMDNVALPLLLIFTPTTAFLGMLLQDIENRAATETALKVSEKKQRKAQEQLENLISNLPGGIYRRVLCPDDTEYVEYYLGRLPRALGVETEFGKKSSKIMSDLVAPAYRKIRDDAVRQSAEQMTPCIFEYPVYMPDESVIWVQSVSTPHRRENGEIVWDGLNLDITQRKQAEGALYESGKSLRGAIDSLQEGFALFDADDRLIAINDVYRRINPFAQGIMEKGLCFEDLLRANVGAGRLVSAIGREEEFIRERLERHHNPKGRIIHEISDGKWYMAQEVRTPEGGTVSTFVDISDLKMAEKALRTSEQRLKDIAEAASDWFWEQDAAFRFTDLGEFANNNFLNRAKDAIGQTRWGFAGINPEEDQHWQNHVDDLVAHRSFRDFRYSAIDDDSTEIVFSVSGKPVFSADGTFTGYRGSVTNLSELAQARNANERFSQALEHLDEGLALWDAEGKLVLCNNYLRKVAGPTGVHLRPGITFKNWLRAHIQYDSIPEAIGREEAWIAERLAYFQNPVGAFKVQRRGHWYQFRLQKLPDGSTMHHTIDIHDIKLSEDALRQAEKFKAVGQLTGGIAHDFNNLLHIITGNLGMLDEDLRHDTSAQKMILAAKMAAFRGGELTKQLLAFSRQQALHPEIVAVNEVIIDTLKLLERTLGENIMITTAFGEGLGRVNIDPGMLGNAILNLAINARDAMPNGGKLLIETATVDINQEAIGQGGLVVSGPYVQITVSDTGTGMGAETLNHVFEPFFTTKEVGKGSGMGLSMVYGFVTQSGGHVSIDSEEGKGTAIKLYFATVDALVDASSGEAKEAEDKTKSAAKGDEIILVVEDDKEVRNVTVMMLSRLGYEVLEAEDGPSALALLGNGGKRVDLVLSDVVMPSGMSGLDLARELRRHYQDIKVLMASGYSEGSTTAEELDEIDTILLSKPFNFEELAAAVRDVLDQ